ncbi:unnamed protein product, partial [Hymenolepis diminuta]
MHILIAVGCDEKALFTLNHVVYRRLAGRLPSAGFSKWCFYRLSIHTALNVCTNREQPLHFTSLLQSAPSNRTLAPAYRGAWLYYSSRPPCDRHFTDILLLLFL